MIEIFVNLKRFDVPREEGGICPKNDPGKWMEWVIAQSIKLGLGKMKNVHLTYLVPEALILNAIKKLNKSPGPQRKNISIGCQSVFREDIVKGGNFGAFTSNRPAAAAKNLGCSWAIIAHSEERKDKFNIFEKYEPSIKENESLRSKANMTLNTIINEEVLCALNRGLNVLLCVGETAEERGEGRFEDQKPRIEAVLQEQLVVGLKNIKDKISNQSIVIGYEPRWAIGPGKIPPDADYISFVSAYIKSVVKKELGIDVPVVYGGGLKEENAKMIAQISTISGGLVALTKFTGEIAFEPDGLRKIIDKYIE